MTMHLLPRLAWVAAIAAAFVCAPAASSPSTPAASSQSREQRQLFIAIEDSSGQPVTGKTPDAFHVWEDGAEREILSAVPATDPPSVVVIVHGLTSDDGTQDIRKALAALVGSFRKARPETRMAMVTYPATPKLAPIADNAELDSTATRFAASGQNLILLEAITDACHALAKETSRRRVVIAITSSLKNDGSTQVGDKAVNALKSAGASLWTIDITPSSNKANLQSVMNYEKDSVLATWTLASGGFNNQIFGTTGLTTSVTHLASIVLSQYQVTFSRLVGGEDDRLRVGVAGAEGERVLAPQWSIQ
jgi:hypothetical protein